MTLILTTISNRGIVQASDSNLSAGASSAGTGSKVFDLGFGPGALALAGSYSVGGVAMDQWMIGALTSYAAAHSPTLGGLAAELRRRLEQEMTKEEKDKGSLIHIAGYTSDAEPHPEMHFVRNIGGMSGDGHYTGIAETFATSEDFWGRDYPKHRSGMRYINGYTDGRILYNELDDRLRAFFAEVWKHPAWEFREPRSLDEDGLLVELELRAIATMFLLSDYPAAYIGGEPQLMKVQAPSGAVVL